jgi:biopolymer transport protein TolR
MAGISTEHGSGSLSVELNLVPFIDLLSSLVLFLLVTSVWLQVSVISASVNSKGKAAATVQTDSEKVQIRVTNSGYHISWPGRLSALGLPQQIGRKPEVLMLVMKKATQATHGSFPITALAGDDDVPYEEVIDALDAIKGGGVSSVGLSTD